MSCLALHNLSLFLYLSLFAFTYFPPKLTVKFFFFSLRLFDFLMRFEDLPPSIGVIKVKGKSYSIVFCELSVFRALFLNSKKSPAKKQSFTITMPKKGKDEPEYYYD